MGRLTGACAVLAALLLAAPALALRLITESESALPAEQSKRHDRGIMRVPTVAIVSPSAAAGTMTSPFTLKIRFEGHGAPRSTPIPCF
jgi:hypothetical protein